MSTAEQQDGGKHPVGVFGQATRAGVEVQARHQHRSLPGAVRTLEATPVPFQCAQDARVVRFGEVTEG